MTSHSVKSGRGPDAHGQTTTSTLPTLRSEIKSTLLRGCVVGLFAGIALIGIIENVTRFADPNAIHAEARQLDIPVTAATDQSPLQRQDAISVQAHRADRLDHMAVPTSPTDVATR